MQRDKNPQAYAILERLNQAIGNMLKTKYLANVTFYAVAPWSEIITSIAYAVRCSYHSTLKANPGQLIFGRDMLPDINLQPNYKNMWLRKKNLSIIITSAKMKSE